MKYLKERQFYEDQYDLHTIKECLNFQTNFKAALLSHRNELSEMSDEDFNDDAEWLVEQLLLFIEGERFKNRELIIREWIIKDKERDHQYENAMQPVGVKCRNCSSLMKVINKELHENYGNPKVLFFYKCMKCKKEEIFSQVKI